MSEIKGQESLSKGQEPFSRRGFMKVLLAASGTAVAAGVTGKSLDRYAEDRSEDQNAAFGVEQSEKSTGPEISRRGDAAVIPISRKELSRQLEIRDPTDPLVLAIVTTDNKDGILPVGEAEWRLFTLPGKITEQPNWYWYINGSGSSRENEGLGSITHDHFGGGTSAEGIETLGPKGGRWHAKVGKIEPDDLDQKEVVVIKSDTKDLTLFSTTPGLSRVLKSWLLDGVLEATAGGQKRDEHRTRCFALSIAPVRREEQDELSRRLPNKLAVPRDPLTGGVEVLAVEIPFFALSWTDTEAVNPAPNLAQLSDHVANGRSGRACLIRYDHRVELA